MIESRRLDVLFMLVYLYQISIVDTVVTLKHYI